MFGDYDDDDVSRVGSPWDSLLSGSPSPSPVPTPSTSLNDESEMARRFAESVPRLTPEIEEGNVEYKLRLINPSEERFARLVTQLKWRLGAGAGQAYYEIGVADSGQLIGLQRKELEQSLETLEMMAGEIGASVIIVKEIELPAAMLELSAQTRLWIDLPKGTGVRKQDAVKQVEGGGEGLSVSPGSPLSICLGTETGPETETTETTDAEGDEDFDDFSLDSENELALAASALTLRNSLNTKSEGVLARPHPYLHSHLDRPTAQSSPAIFAVERTVDPEPDTGGDADIEEPTFAIDLEINEVYKPRPTRKRTPANHHPRDRHSNGGANNNGGRKGRKDAAKEGKSGKAARLKPADDTGTVGKAEAKRLERDQRREAKRRALAIGIETETSIVAPVPILANTNGAAASTVFAAAAVVLGTETETINVEIEPASPPGSDELLATLDPDGGPRLIVEVLIVRKSSIEESYLEFGDFSLDV